MWGVTLAEAAVTGVENEDEMEGDDEDEEFSSGEDDEARLTQKKEEKKTMETTFHSEPHIRSFAA